MTTQYQIFVCCACHHLDFVPVEGKRKRKRWNGTEAQGSYQRNGFATADSLFSLVSFYRIGVF